MDDDTNNLPIQDILDECDVNVEKLDVIVSLQPGQSSPTSPVEFDRGLRKAGQTKSVEFFAETDEKKVESSSSDNAQNTVLVQSVIPKSQVRIPSTKRVKFAKSIMNKEVRHLNDYTKAELEMMWMTMPDYLMIRAVIKTTVLMMMRGEMVSEDDEDFCPRGLESKTKLGSRARSRAKLRARFAVLNEQDIQREESFEDPHLIAMAYIDESEESRASAQAKADQDERCARDYLADTQIHGYFARSTKICR
jgi:hypothetical protein